MPFSPILFFPLVSSTLRSPDTVCADQHWLLFPVCKEPPYPYLPSFHQCLQNAAFHNPAFLSCVALAFHVSCINASGLEMGTAYSIANLSSNSTRPPLPHAMHKFLFISCLTALFPSPPQRLLGSDTPLTIMWAQRGRECTTPQVWHTKSLLVCTLSSEQECSLLLVGAPFFCTGLQLCATCIHGPSLFNSQSIL